LRTSRSILRAGPVGGPAATAACVAALVLVGGCSAPDLTPPGTDAPDLAWTLVNPLPFDVRVTDLWGVSPARMFAVCAHGAILACEGGTWREVPSPTTATFWDIHGCDMQHVWAVAEDGLWFFGGRNWRRVLDLELTAGARVFAVGPRDVMLVTGDQRSFHYDGEHWTEYPLEILPDVVHGDWLGGAPDGRYMAVGRNGTYAAWNGSGWNVRLQTNDDNYDFESVAWIPEPDGHWRAVVEITRLPQVKTVVHEDGYWFDQTFFYPAFYAGAAAASDIYPVTWDPRTGTLTLHKPGAARIPVPDLRSVAVRAFPGEGGDDVLVAGGAFSTILTGTIAGGELTRVLPGVSFGAWELAVTTDGSFAATDGYGKVLRGRPGGLSVLDLAPGEDLDLWLPAPGLLQVTSDTGLILQFAGDAAPTIVPPPPGEDIFEVGGLGADDFWVSRWQEMHHWDGAAWTTVPWPLGGNAARDIVGLPSGEVFAMSEAALGRWDGSAWVDVGPADVHTCYSIEPGGHGDDLLFLCRRDDAATRVLLRGRPGAWESLGAPENLPQRAYAGPDETVWTDDFFGASVWRDGRWSTVDLPGGFRGTEAAKGLTADATGGVYLVLDTGSIYRLATDGGQP